MKHRGRKKSIPRIIFEIFNTAFFILMIILCIAPIWHVVCASFSDANWVMAQKGVITHIKGFNVIGYKMVFKNKEIWQGYLNTIIYCVATTALGLLITVMIAYVTAVKDVLWANAIMLFASFTMMFGGGIIASYIINTNLGLFNNRLAIILPSCFSVMYLILIRTAMKTVPESLVESAMLDGAGPMSILFKIMLPLIKATLATVILYYLVMQWNSWFQAQVYLRNRQLYPLQIIIKEILVQGDITSTTSVNANDYSGDLTVYKQLIKYCTIVVSTLPIFAFYPFIQKYFESGVMIGAVKG